MFQKWEEIKKQLLYHLESIQNRILESNTFNAFKEKYQSFSLSHQKIIKYGMVVATVLLMSFVPFYYFYSSSDYWSEFKNKRKLSLELLKVRNHQSHFSDFSEYKLRQDISDIVKKYKEKDYFIKDKVTTSKEKNLKKIIYEVKVEHLNIRQVAQMGTELNDIPPVRLSALTMEESKNYPKHYNVSFDLSAYFHKLKKPKRTSKRKTKNIDKQNLKSKERKTEREKLNRFKFDKGKKDLKKDSKKKEDKDFEWNKKEKSGLFREDIKKEKLNRFKFDKKKIDFKKEKKIKESKSFLLNEEEKIDLFKEKAKANEGLKDDRLKDEKPEVRKELPSGNFKQKKLR